MVIVIITDSPASVLQYAFVLVGELTDGALRGEEWLSTPDVIRGGEIFFPSNLTRDESIVKECDNWDSDIGASSEIKQKEEPACTTE